MLVGSDVGWVLALGKGIDGMAVSCALSDLAWWGVLCMGGLTVLRESPAVNVGVMEGYTSMMLAKRRSAWWKASWR